MLTAPYTSAMRLGQGFNSYNHEVCVNDAVIIDSENPGGDIYGGSDTTISQIVSYCTRHVDKVSQVIAAMNISAAASVKTAGGGGGLAGSYIDSDTFKESNINFFCQVKVTNQVIMGADLLKFNDIPTFRAEDSAHFTKVYGDSFISGFIEGGELNAIISIKTSDKKTINSIKASLEGSFGKGKFSADIKGEGGKEDTQALSQSETTITVNWTGGGIIKPAEELWSIDSLVKAAAAFPERVAKTPQRTHAILTKYENLRSFHLLIPRMPTPLNYALAELYTNDLLDAFTDYKSIWTVIHQYAEAVEFGTAILHKAEDLPGLHSQNPSRHDEDGVLVEKDPESMSEAEQAQAYKKLYRKPAFRHTGKPYGNTLHDLDRARLHCRLEMGKILNEIHAIEADPSKAATADPSAVFLNPAIFRKLLPTKVDIDQKAPAVIANVFYPTSQKPLPSPIDEWKNRIPSITTQKLRMTGFGGVSDTNYAKKFEQTLFEDFNGVPVRAPNTSHIEKITVYSIATGVTGIEIKYQGQKSPRTIGKCKGDGPETKDFPSNDPITGVIVETAKHKGVAGVVKLTFKTRANTAHEFDCKNVKKADLEANSDDSFPATVDNSWSLRGLWGSTADDDEVIARLGAIFEHDP